MKTMKQILCLALVAAMLLASGCSPATTPTGAESQPTQTSSTETTKSGQVASAEDMAGVENVVQEGMVPIEGSAIQDGVYSIAVDSSSSMFKITACELTVEGGQMTAVMHMGGKGYLKLFMGTGEEAVAANEEDCIPFEENAEGEHTFTVPVEALDKGIPCAAFSKSKEMWYDRTLVFRADSLPMDAFQEGAYTKVESLSLADGSYTVSVQLEGCKETVPSPYQ